MKLLEHREKLESKKWEPIKALENHKSRAPFSVEKG